MVLFFIIFWIIATLIFATVLLKKISYTRNKEFIILIGITLLLLFLVHFFTVLQGYKITFTKSYDKEFTNFILSLLNIIIPSSLSLLGILFVLKTIKNQNVIINLKVWKEHFEELHGLLEDKIKDNYIVYNHTTGTNNVWRSDEDKTELINIFKHAETIFKNKNEFTIDRAPYRISSTSDLINCYLEYTEINKKKFESLIETFSWVYNHLYNNEIAPEENSIYFLKLVKCFSPELFDFMIKHHKLEFLPNKFKNEFFDGCKRYGINN